MPTVVKSLALSCCSAEVVSHTVGDMVWFKATVRHGEEETVVRGPDGVAWFRCPTAAEEAAMDVMATLQEASNRSLWSALAWFASADTVAE